MAPWSASFSSRTLRQFFAFSAVKGFLPQSTQRKAAEIAKKNASVTRSRLHGTVVRELFFANFAAVLRVLCGQRLSTAKYAKKSRRDRKEERQRDQIAVAWHRGPRAFLRELRGSSLRSLRSKAFYRKVRKEKPPRSQRRTPA